nr:MAG TPA: hypothetical protein [Caudoviricetes sp.]
MCRYSNEHRCSGSNPRNREARPSTQRHTETHC